MTADDESITPRPPFTPMSKHLDEIITRHFPDQCQVYPNREKARAAILEYSAWEASFLPGRQPVETGEGLDYWKHRALEAEARLRELKKSELLRTAPKLKSLGDSRFQGIFAPWKSNR